MLPKTEHYHEQVKLCWTGKAINLRPMTIGEEKILLTAQESDDRTDVLRAVTQIINACTDDAFDANTLPLYEIEWLFCNLRRMSVSDVVKLQYNVDDDVFVPFEIKLADFKMTMPTEKPSNVCTIGNLEIGLKHPSIMSILDDEQDITHVLYNSISYVKEGKTDFNFSSHPKEEALEWIDGLSPTMLEKTMEYLNAVPTLEYKTTVKSEDGVAHDVHIAGMFDFFQL